MLVELTPCRSLRQSELFSLIRKTLCVKRGSKAEEKEDTGIPSGWAGVDKEGQPSEQQDIRRRAIS